MRLLNLLCATVVLCAVVTGVMAVWAAQHPTQLPSDIWASESPRNAEIVREDRAIQWNDESGYWVASDYTSQYMNVIDGERLTLGAPRNATHSVYLFGNSEIFGQYVDDSGTIASALQALLPQYRVRNLGMTGRTLDNELFRLKATDVKPGDIVVFVDGFMEIDSVYADAKWGGRNELVCDNFQSLAVIQWLCDPQSAPPALFDPTWITNHVTAELAHSNSLIDAARQFTTARGASFYHFLQPIDLTSPTMYPGFDRVCAVAWSQMDGIPLLLNSKYFDDFAHTDEAGNQAIASFVYDQIMKR